MLSLIKATHWSSGLKCVYARLSQRGLARLQNQAILFERANLGDTHNVSVALFENRHQRQVAIVIVSVYPEPYGLVYGQDEHPEADLYHFLQYVGLDLKALSWISDRLDFAQNLPYRVCRKDRHGRVFLVETFPNREAAERHRQEAENAMLDQAYWVEKVKLPRILAFKRLWQKWFMKRRTR